MPARCIRSEACWVDQRIRPLWSQATIHRPVESSARRAELARLALARCTRIRAKSSSSSIGLVTKSTPPAASARTTCSLSLNPVMKMIGTSSKPRFALRIWQVSKPSRPGITASISTMSGELLFASETAWRPLLQVRTSMPSSWSASDSMDRASGESSTTSTRLAFSSSGIVDLLDHGQEVAKAIIRDEQPHMVAEARRRRR